MDSPEALATEGKQAVRAQIEINMRRDAEEGQEAFPVSKLGLLDLLVELSILTQPARPPLTRHR